MEILVGANGCYWPQPGDRVLYHIVLYTMYKSPDWGKEGRGKELEQSHVYSVYNQIAPCFTEISQKAWPNVRKFLKNQPSGSLIADIGRCI